MIKRKNTRPKDIILDSLISFGKISDSSLNIVVKTSILEVLTDIRDELIIFNDREDNEIITMSIDKKYKTKE